MAFLGRVAPTAFLFASITAVVLPWLLIASLYMPHSFINKFTIKSQQQVKSGPPHNDEHRFNITPEQLEEVRRQITSGLKTTAVFIRAKLQKNASAPIDDDMKSFLAEVEDRLRVIQLDLSNFDRTVGLAAWREREAAALSKEVQRRIHALQNPPDCGAAQKLICRSRGAGAGSNIHHLVYCIMAAYGSGKIMVLQSQRWRYSPEGWEAIFQPLSRTCFNVTRKDYGKWPGDSESPGVVFPEWDQPSPKPSHQPMALPRDIASRLQRFHETPFDWWVGQFIAYMMRFQPEMQRTIDEMKTQLKFKHPIVGVQIRRTDKKQEAHLYSLEEYMVHVENYYLGLDLVSATGVPVHRRVYLASDQASIITEARKKYKNYEFLWHDNKAEDPKTRYNFAGFKDFIIDLYFLAHADHLVCTMSSNVCRLAYELMQYLRADAPSRTTSIDTNYFFLRTRPRHVQVRFPHQPDRAARDRGFMEVAAGQVLTAYKKNFVVTGYTQVFALGDKKLKNVPDYKLRDILDVVNVTLPEHVLNYNKEED